MKKLLVGISGILLVCLLSCCMPSAGAQDWHLPLMNGYSIDRAAPTLILVYHSGDETSHGDGIVIRAQVIAFQYNERYIGIERVPADENEGKWISDEKFDRYRSAQRRGTHLDDAEWYLIDSEATEVAGPLTEEEYLAMLEDLGVEEMPEWIHTDQKPEGAEP